MLLLILGLLVFLGIHSVRIVADPWRGAMVERLGLMPWKGLYTLVSLVGLALIIWGYGQTRMAPVVLWSPPIWTRHLASLLTLVSFILIVAAYLPIGRIKASVGHPMVAGVKLWAVSHLLSNGTLADLLLFGSFLVWAIVGYASLRRRDRLAGVVRRAGPVWCDLLAVVIGAVAWYVFALHLHAPLIGVRPFG